MEYKIIPAQLKHLDALTDLEITLFDKNLYHALSRRSFRHLITKGNADIFLATQNSCILGMAIILYKSNSSYGRLYSLAVDDKYRGHGIGKKLFQYCEKIIRKKGHVGVLLETRAGRKNLLEFYKNLGCDVIGKLPNYYADGASGIKLRKLF